MGEVKKGEMHPGMQICQLHQRILRSTGRPCEWVCPVCAPSAPPVMAGAVTDAQIRAFITARSGRPESLLSANHIQAFRDHDPDMTALTAALSIAPGRADGPPVSEQKLGRFGHHPVPSIDFTVEVEAIQGLAYDYSVGLAAKNTLEDRIFRAMQFNVGVDEVAMNAKATLRLIEKGLKSAAPPALTGEK